MNSHISLEPASNLELPLCDRRTMHPKHILTVAFALVVSIQPELSAQQTTILPRLVIDAPASLQETAERVGRFKLQPLETAMMLAGLTHPGQPIQVLLIAEDSLLARSTPRWISGFADSDRQLVVLFPERSKSYPTSSLETLLHHEIAHVLFSRAARGQPLPRWFNEGLALAAERPVGLGDRSRLAWSLIRHGRISLEALEQLFSEGRVANQRAYTISGALVRYLLVTYGDTSMGHILALMGEGQPFEAAFEELIGETVDRATDKFWSQQTFLSWWVPFLTGPAFLWTVITLLALYATTVRRRRRTAQHLRWLEEELTLDEALLPQPRSDNDHGPINKSSEVH
ncbi:MAG: hypothetical protein CL484_06125 [Acidobacteria bacterium]|nr:hypothetical protein [Acidobacteriota bacterium]